MTSLYYEEIYSNFLATVSDCTFVKLEQFEALGVLQELLHKALAGGYVRKQFETLKLNDDSQILSYELKNSIDEDADKDFVIGIATNYMVAEWAKKQVYRIEHTIQFFGGAEQKYYSQSQHLTELRTLKDSALNDAQNFISEHNFTFNKYLSGGSK